MAALLLDAGAAVRLASPGRDSNGMAALHFAARHGPLTMVKLLLDANADASQRCDDGTLPLDLVSNLFTRDAASIRELLLARLPRRRGLMAG